MTDKARQTYPELATDHVGMKMLWQTVLTQLINDATTSVRGSIKTKERIDIDNARAAIMDQTRDFKTICDFAGYEADRVRVMVAPRIEVARQSDAPKDKKVNHG